MRHLGKSDRQGRALIGAIAAAAIVAAGWLVPVAQAQDCEPSILWTVDSAGWAEDVAVGHVVYIAAGDAGFLLASPSPYNPGIYNSIDTLGYARGVAASGVLGFVITEESGLSCIDASSVYDPQVPGSVGLPYGGSAVAVSGDRVYATTWTTGLHVIDVSDPSDLSSLGFVITPGEAQGVEVSGSLAYVADGFEGLKVIDVSDPSDMTIIGSLNTPGWAQGVAVVGSVAYVADGSYGLRVISVSDPSTPTQLGSVNTPGDARDVVVNGSLAYVADGYSGLHVIDVSDPSAPAIIGSVDTGEAHGVAIYGDMAYAADGGNGLQMITNCDCNGNGILDADEISNGTGYDANGNGKLDECEGYAGTTTIEDLDQGETTAIVPGGGTLDPTANVIVQITNVSGPDDASVTVTQSWGNPYPNGGLYGILGGTLSVAVETTLQDGEFWMRVSIPFGESVVPPGSQWYLIDLTYYDPVTGNWVLAVQGNIADSPGHTGPVGDRHGSIDYPGPLSDDLGDYGVNWDNDVMRGFAWANVDHLSDFAVGINTCPADTDVSGIVDVDDLLNVILGWSTDGLGTSGVYADADNSGVVDVDDLLTVILAWGECP